MYPRLYLHSLQSATVNKKRTEITFETRHANGCHYYFSLSRNQFLAFDDVFFLIDSSDCTHGHFPLGENLWFYYSANEATLYVASNDKRPYFTFESFSQYKRFAHQRILSLLRLKEETKVSVSRRENGGKGRRRGTPNHKRPISTVMQSANRCDATKRVRGERKTLSRAADDAVMPHMREEGAVLPERNSSNSRWRIDSSSSSESESDDLLSFDAVQTPASITLDSVESE